MNKKMKNNFISVLNVIGRKNTEELIKWLEAHNFFTVPASVVHHNNERSGLLKHSLEVCNEALHLRAEIIAEHPELADALSKESVAIAALLHDVCKWNVYFESPRDGNIKCNKKTRDEGHGLKSVEILERCGYEITDDEKLAIWWHMGYKHEPSYEHYKFEYDKSCDSPLCQLIRKADYNATHLKERFEAEIKGLKGYNTNRLLNYLSKSNFYTTRSGSHHHYSTGTVAHSLGVWRHMMKIYDGPDKNEAAAVALLHDIAMMDRSKYYKGHGNRSMHILRDRLKFGLSDEALEVVLYHKGHMHPGHDEQETRKQPLWQNLYDSDHFDADHDITDVHKHFMDEKF